MKFNYNKDVSRILDYLGFPRIYYFINEYHTSKDDSLAKVIDEKHLEFAKNMESKLESSKDVIKELYQNDIYSSNDYYNILLTAFPVDDYLDEHLYLNDLLEIEDHTFKEKMIEAMLTMGEDDNKANVVSDESQALQYINEMKIDSANKWNLLMMIQKPKEQLKKMIDLLAKYEDLFYEHYNQMKDNINKTGQALETKLSEDTGKTFNELTFNSIEYDFQQGECGYLYVSSIFPYSMKLNDDNPLRVIWGIEMERSFKMIHEINENQLTQRVKVFKALGDKTRYETLKLLTQGVDSVKQIAKTLDVSSATISYHINEFLTSGIVHIRRGQQKKSTYQVDYDRLNNIIEAMKEDLNFKK